MADRMQYVSLAMHQECMTATATATASSWCVSDFILATYRYFALIITRNIIIIYVHNERLTYTKTVKAATTANIAGTAQARVSDLPWILRRSFVCPDDPPVLVRSY